MRDVDFNVSSWVGILGFLVSYSNVLIRVLDGDRAGQIAYFIFFSLFCWYFFTYRLFAVAENGERLSVKAICIS